MDIERGQLIDLPLLSYANDPNDDTFVTLGIHSFSLISQPWLECFPKSIFLPQHHVTFLLSTLLGRLPRWFRCYSKLPAARPRRIDSKNAFSESPGKLSLVLKWSSLLARPYISPFSSLL